MEPQIQYAKTEDGVSIAYWTMGEGPPLVISPNLTGGSGQMAFEFPGARPFWTRLSHRLQLISFDYRGTGMSQRDVIDYSLAATSRDLSAVVDRIGHERFALYGHVIGASQKQPRHGLSARLYAGSRRLDDLHHPNRRFRVHRRDRVGVSIEGDPNAGVSQALRDDLDVDASLEG